MAQPGETLYVHVMVTEGAPAFVELPAFGLALPACWLSSCV